MSGELKFWNWFKQKEANYFYLDQIEEVTEKERLLDDLLSHLHEYCQHLYFEVGGYPDEKQDLIITAGGNVDFFGEVEALVDAVPELDHWNVIAFKPPATENFTIEYEGVELDASTMYFVPLENKTSPQLGLRIYIDNYDSTQANTFLTAAYLVLDNILGEKSNAIDIGYVKTDDLASVHDREELIELNKLLRFIEWRKSKLND